MTKIEMKVFLKISVFIFLTGLANPGVCALTGFNIVKKRVTDALLLSDVNDARAESLLHLLQADGTWPDIDYQDVSREGFQHHRHSGNLVTLAQTYKTRSSRFFRNPEMKNAIELALGNWTGNDYISDNWWYNEIGTPGNLVHLMLLIGEELPGDLVEKTQPIIRRAHIDGPGARPGGDRIKIAGIQAKNHLFRGEQQSFDQVLKVIENEIKYVEWIGMDYGYTYRILEGGFRNRSEGGRGIQYDNSFHHRTDGVNNTLSYGLGYADAFIEWAVYTAGTEYSFSDEKMEQLVDYFLDGICKTAVYGKYPDPGVKNRSISRRGALRPFSAKSAEDLLLTTDYRKDELQEIVDIRKKGVKPTLSHATFFRHSEHFTFQRPDFFTSVRMYSTRLHNMEQPYNSEGLLNHHRGDGTNYISVTGDEYDDLAPVFDYQKVPGATIMQKPEMPPAQEIQKTGLTDFVGAVTDGIYGAAAIDFKSPHDPLIARKSWFFFDEEYVCLGAGISCRQQLPVVTTINQCLLRDDVILSSGSRRSIVKKGERELENVEWIFHDRIGYVFPEPAAVMLKNREETGSWWTINKQSSSPKEELGMEVFKLSINHGIRPSDETYAYIVVPGISPEKMEANRSGKNIRIISNTPYLQAAMNTGLGICQAVFYKAGEIQITEGVKLIADHPGIVMLKMEEENVTEVSVSDPNRELGRFHISVSARIEKSGEKFQAVWNESKGLSEIAIELSEGVYAGKSVTIKL